MGEYRDSGKEHGSYYSRMGNRLDGDILLSGGYIGNGYVSYGLNS